MYAIFNKNNKFVGYSDTDFPDYPNLEILKLKIPEEQCDLSKWWWEGDMLTGKMVEQKIQNRS